MTKLKTSSLPSLFLLQVEPILSSKPIHAGWLVEFYNHMTTSKGKEIINSGWKAAGISDAVKLDSSKLPPTDPLHDIDVMLGDESESSNRHLLALCDVPAE